MPTATLYRSSNHREPPIEDATPVVSGNALPALLSLQDHLKPNEIAYRRARLDGASRFFGLDIHKEYALAYAVDRDLNPTYGPVRVSWDHFVSWIRKTLTKVDAVVIEMTTNTWDTYDALVDHCHSVTVVHPPSLKLITSTPVMTDKKACESLAILLAAGLMRPVWVPDPKHRAWRQLVSTRHDLVRSATRAKNRLHAILHRHHLAKPKMSISFAPSQREWWFALPLDPIEQLTARQLLDTLNFNQKQVRELEILMARELLADQRMPYLIQLPGIRVVGAMTLLSAIGPIERFPDPQHLVGYAGLGARVHDSGKRKTTGRITKQGRSDLRSVLVSAALSASRTHPYWKSQFKTLAQRIGKRKAIVAIARRYLVSIWHILKKREADRYASETMVARTFLSIVYKDIGASNLPDGLAGPAFVRQQLDRLGIGRDLRLLKYGSHTYRLPPSSLPGAPPTPVQDEHGPSQNARDAKSPRAAKAMTKRRALAKATNGQI